MKASCPRRRPLPPQPFGLLEAGQRRIETQREVAEPVVTAVKATADDDGHSSLDTLISDKVEKATVDRSDYPLESKTSLRHRVSQLSELKGEGMLGKLVRAAVDRC